MSRVKSSYDNETGILTIDHGEGVVGEFNMNDLEKDFLQKEEVIKEALVYAMKQKLADKVAGMKESSNEEKLTAQEELWNQITVDRLWAARKAGSGGKVTKAAITKKMEAIEIPGLTEDQKKELLAKLLA